MLATAAGFRFVDSRFRQDSQEFSCGLDHPRKSAFRSAKEEGGAMLEFTVGIKVAGEHRSVTVSAEDALIAALKVKHQKPEAAINYVRRVNRRGDRRHPHTSVGGEG
jgi:hypothetical protein